MANEKSNPPRNPNALIAQYDDQYGHYNSAAHPPTPPRLSAPALNWHFAVWRDKNVDHEVIEIISDLLNNKELEIVKINSFQNDEKVPVFWLTNWKFLKENGKWYHKIVEKLDGISENKEKNPFSLGRFQCSFMWGRGQYVKLSIEMHDEFTAFTFWLPVFRVGPDRDQGIPCDGGIGDNLRNCLGEIMYLINGGSSESVRLNDKLQLLDSINKHMSLNIDLENFNVDQHKKRYEYLGDYLYREIWTLLANIIAGRNERSFAPFCDFRSIILPSAFPFCPRDKPAGTIWPGRARAFGSDRFAIMGRINRFVETDANASAELTGSTLLNSRVIYGSSLGAPRVDAKHLDGVRKARFLMVAKPSSRWQLGRLVERLNLMGTYRMAALRDLSSINAANGKLRALGEAVATVEANANRGDRPVDTAAQFVELSAIGALGTGGLNYRVERSRYYVDAWRRILPDLRVGRIEGYQPYDEFVIRRYAAIWDRINRVGIRFERLAQRLDFLANRQTALAQAKQTASIEQNARTQTHLMHTAHNVEIIALTYYSSQLSGTIISEFLHWPFGIEIEFGHYNGALAILVAPLLCYAIKPNLLWQSNDEHKEGEAKGHWRWSLRARLSAIAACVLISAWLFVADNGPLFGRPSDASRHNTASSNHGLSTPPPTAPHAAPEDRVRPGVPSITKAPKSASAGHSGHN